MGGLFIRPFLLLCVGARIVLTGLSDEFA